MHRIRICLILGKNVKSDSVSNFPKIHGITFLPLYVHSFDNQYVVNTLAARILHQ